MKAVVQRVQEARVAVEGRTVGEIGRGLLILLCVEEQDGEAEVDLFAGKIARMRIFADEVGRMNLSLADVAGAVLAVSQFTLAADWRRGNRPSFSRAGSPDHAQRQFVLFCERLRGFGIPVETGQFAAHMEVALVNDGPVTIWMDTAHA